MSALVIRHYLPSLWGDQLRFLLNTTNDPLSSEFKVHNGYVFLVVSCSDDGCLIADIFDIGATKARSQCCKAFCVLFYLDVSIEDQGFEVDLEDLTSALEIWQVDLYEAIKSTRSGEGWIQNFFLVGSRKYNNIRICIETIHLH